MCCEILHNFAVQIYIFIHISVCLFYKNEHSPLATINRMVRHLLNIVYSFYHWHMPRKR